MAHIATSQLHRQEAPLQQQLASEQTAQQVDLLKSRDQQLAQEEKEVFEMKKGTCADLIGAGEAFAADEGRKKKKEEQGIREQEICQKL